MKTDLSLSSLFLIQFCTEVLKIGGVDVKDLW